MLTPFEKIKEERDMFLSSDLDYEKYFIVLARTRDSERITNSNWRVAIRELMPKEDEIFRMSHWLCGWVEYLLIPKDSSDTLLNIAEDIKKSEMDGGPYNDEDYYALESEEIEEIIANPVALKEAINSYNDCTQKDNVRILDRMTEEQRKDCYSTYTKVIVSDSDYKYENSLIGRVFDDDDRERILHLADLGLPIPDEIHDYIRDYWIR